LDKVALNGSLIILVCPSLDVLRKRYLARNYSQQIKLEELEFSRELFMQELGGICTIHYHSRDYDELNQVIEKVVNHEAICSSC
jgi:hypothetical protein